MFLMHNGLTWVEVEVRNGWHFVDCIAWDGI
jgi:hypothetical protein